MKVLTVEAHNVMRIADIDFSLEGHHLYLVGGRNSQGKSSALNAFVMAVCGKQGCDFPEIPLREGEKKGFVKVELDGMTIERHFKRGKDGGISETLKVLDENGDKVERPQTVLNKLYAARGFDPLAFAKMDRKKQAEALRKVVGIDFTESDKKLAKLIEERRDVNRDVAFHQAQLDGMTKFDDAPEEEISVAELSHELDTRQEYNHRTESMKRGLSDQHQQLEEDEADLKEARQKVAMLERRVAENMDSCRDLEQEIEQREIKDTLEIRQKIETAEEDNRKYRSNLEYAKAVRTLKQVSGVAEKVAGEIEAEREAQAATMQAAKWPVEGLGLDDDGVTYKGLPFDQSSKSVRIMTSVKMGMSINPELRMLVCQDGNDLDDETLAELEAVLSENDFQMLLEVVTRNEADEQRCCVVIEDGSQKLVGAA